MAPFYTGVDTDELNRPPDDGGAGTKKLDLKKDPYGPITRKIEIDDFPHQPATLHGGLPCTIENTAHLLAAYGIIVRFNVITKKVEVIIPGHTGSVENAANTALTFVLSLAALHGLPIGLISSYIELLADRNPFNPVRVWIEREPWDGEDRLEALCDTLVTAPDFPVGFKDILIIKWLLSAVAAALMVSGFRARGVLTLQGPQGLGKTSWVASLVSDPALRALVVKLDHHLDGGNKDSILIAIAHWIVEIGELESSFKKDVARLKGFLTNIIDKVRRPYGKAETEYQRRTVFSATVNSYDFLIDSTGNSRFWTLPLIAVNYDHGIDMQQVFAQLAVMFHAGEQWWLTSEEEFELAFRNSRHRAFSPVRELLQGVVDFDAPAGAETITVTATELLVRVGIDKPSNQQAKECGALLREHFGNPKRTRGRDKWPVPLRPKEDRGELIVEESDDCGPGEESCA